ncbi:MAG: 4-hydroxy-tetrahydrodipicolinate reductase [Candidatus Schekmanbacteria bacterium]|nr:4-hydroxy-tetrahydrodipicolinate reductase [Candidatus Schekmanbacteria bacterium]
MTRPDAAEQTPVLRLGVCGYLGRMGLQTVAAAQDCPDIELVLGLVTAEELAALAPRSPDNEQDVIFATVGGAGPALRERRVDVVVDFSAPAATTALARVCRAGDRATAVVAACTALGAEERAALASLSEVAAVVIAPNLSIGANLLFSLAASATGAMPPPPATGIEITDIHHRHKRDFPSGTAKQLIRSIAAALGRANEDILHGDGVAATAARPAGMRSLRVGEVVGEHRVLFATDVEEVEIVHRVHSRRAFAEGALRAARFAATAPPGSYTMADVLAADVRQPASG